MKRTRRYYGAWAGNPIGIPENPERCIVEVAEPTRWIRFYQCQRKRGYGPDDEYCKQHAKMMEMKRYVSVPRRKSIE